jgi:hypothetical protein
MKTENPANKEKALKYFLASDYYTESDEEWNLDSPTAKIKEWDCFFEHGQLWIKNNLTDKTYSVVDAKTATGEFYFDFELVSEGIEL